MLNRFRSCLYREQRTGPSLPSRKEFLLINNTHPNTAGRKTLRYMNKNNEVVVRE